eukprot:218812_1
MEDTEQIPITSISNGHILQDSEDSDSDANQLIIQEPNDSIFDTEQIQAFVSNDGHVKLNTFKLLLSLSINYMFSLIDNITDILMIIEVSPGGCIYNLFVIDNQKSSIDIMYAFLWISTIFGIMNTICFKFYYAFKISKQHDLSYWKAIKCVALQYFLQCHISSPCNKYRMLKLIVVFIEDFPQFVIGLYINYAMQDINVIVMLSILTSYGSILFEFGKEIFIATRAIILYVCCCTQHCKQQYDTYCYQQSTILTIFYVLFLIIWIIGLSWLIIPIMFFMLPHTRGYAMADIQYTMNGIIQFNTSYLNIETNSSEYYYVNNFTHLFHDGLSPVSYEYISCVDAKFQVFKMNDNWMDNIQYPLVCLYLKYTVPKYGVMIYYSKKEMIEFKNIECYQLKVGHWNILNITNTSYSDLLVNGNLYLLNINGTSFFVRFQFKSIWSCDNSWYMTQLGFKGC